MLNQFYNYLSNLLIDYWNDAEKKVEKGNRYYLRLENEEEVANFAMALKTSRPELVEEFEYKHLMGESYKTFCLKFDDIRLVIANTSKNVLTDYLALLRNLVSEQSGMWENTALISIVSDELDTIPGGSLDLQSEGMPLHPSVLYKKISEEILKSKLTKSEKKILEFHLEGILKENKYMKVTLTDFEEIVTILEKGNISKEDYKSLGMFIDLELSQINGLKQFYNRLNKNKEIFEFVRLANELKETEEQLQNNFTSSGVEKLKQDNWKELDFKEVESDWDKAISEKKDKKIHYNNLISVNKLEVWERTLGNTSTQKRKHHIIVFNPDYLEEIELIANFSFEGLIKSLNNDYVHKRISNDPAVVETKVTNMHIKIPFNNKETTYSHVTYKHENKTNLTTEFYICILPITSQFLNNYSANYVVNAKKRRIELLSSDSKVTLGDNPSQSILVNQLNQSIEINSDESYFIDVNFDLFEEEEIEFKLRIDGFSLKIMLNMDTESLTRISGSRIWKNLRETNKNFIWNRDNNKVIHQNVQYDLVDRKDSLFDLEYNWLKENLRSGKINSGILEAVNIDLSEELREAYSRFITCFKSATQIPSFTSVSDEYKSRGLEYIYTFINEISNFQNGKPVGKKGMDLYKLGIIKSNNTIYLTPFHPLMVAFKLKLYEKLNNEKIDDIILSRLSPEALLPFIDNEGLYRPQHQKDYRDWLILKPVNEVASSDINTFLDKVIFDKLRQFKEHFSYLFTPNSNAPFLINVINFPEDLPILKGIIKFMEKELINKGIDGCKPIEVTLYSYNNIRSSFEKFSKCKTVEEVEGFLGEKIISNKDLDKETIVRLIQDNLLFYKNENIKNLDHIKYAHSTFYKMLSQENFAVQSMFEMPADIALEGLYSSVSKCSDKETYKTGFGIKNYSLDDNDYLVHTAKALNELVGNLRNDGYDSFVKENVLMSRVDIEEESTLIRLFEQSHWVTFIEPTVDLGFFKNFSNDLVIIHYSDQYTSSSKYDAITVTNKTKQYYKVIEEFLVKQNLNPTKKGIENTIQAFNTFNGEWLLRIVSVNDFSDKEKLSIISAIKFILSILNHDKIIWIPISLEEILRVAGVFNLSKAGGIFSAKNLGLTGVASDDLLLIGLEELEDKLLVHFYPVEVKIGYNSEDVINKAKEQVNKTKNIILDTLVKNNKGSFKEQFYKHFFVQLILSNLQKIIQSDFWIEKNYTISKELHEKLVKLNFEITDHLVPYIGKGAVLSFKEATKEQICYLEDNIQIIHFPKVDGFNAIVQSIPEINNWIHSDQHTFLRKRFLLNMYNNQNYSLINEQESELTKTKLTIDDSELIEETSSNSFEEGYLIKGLSNEIPSLESNIIELEIGDQTEKIKESIITGLEVTDYIDQKNSLEDVRVLFGKLENANKNISWEYGHNELANRHLLISGKSGQGKTYLIQCMLLELSKQGISSLIVDYTEGFSKNHLEPEFISALSDKFIERVVYSEKLPINPFARNVKTISSLEIPETNIDIAERVKSIFLSVYTTLGIQQLNIIYEKVIIGLERYDKNMSLNYLKLLLEEDGSQTALKALSQIRPLVDRNPFITDNPINWKEYFKKNGNVFVIQLSGYPQDVKKIITEFLLWDLWNYSIREGSKSNPMPVILDEAQNLDFSIDSPSAKILTEGRKFGWSAWFATQFLKGQLNTDELSRLQNAAQKIFFAQSDADAGYVANSLISNERDKRFWESKLLNLKKGECIVQGPQLETNGLLSNPQISHVKITEITKR